MIYLIVKPCLGERAMVAYGYQHLWPELRQVIWIARDAEGT